MSSIEPKYRRVLNDGQVKVLELLYSFRFSSAEQLASYFNKPNGKSVQKRLRILEEQGYIAKRYDKSYKLQGKPASYYLLPKGAKYLKASSAGLEDMADQAIKNRYKDKTASDKFISHSLDIFSVFLKFSQFYGNRLNFFTKTDLNHEDYEYFPNWLPDVFINIQSKTKNNGEDKEFFLDIFDESIPFFVRVRRIKSYLTYADSGEWEGDKLPTILMVCENTSTQKRVRRRIAKEINELWDDIAVFYTTTTQQFEDSQRNDKIWELATNSDDFISLS